MLLGVCPPHGQDYTARVLDVVDVQNRLDADVLEVKTIRLVVVRADRFGVVVNHDSRQALVAERPDRAHRAPIELDRRADAVHT